ncbi:BA14K family protein [Phyllobacterium sp. SB3]|uniref:BA14K family protein n=1 Tax=Phyllobacterium sp. SB3 TaxID=3156073 RepID=UPI0032AF62D3
MTKILSRICVAGLCLAVSFTPIIPAFAAPPMLPQIETPSNVEQIQHRRDRRSPRVIHRAGRWNGHRGYRHSRPGYRRHSDGWWYPLAAFGAGAIIGGTIARQPSRSSNHVNWCANRWRSYRSSDNTYQPYSGPRQLCVSPYR